MQIKATIVEFEQGSEPWKQHRLHSLNASELGAAMGLSKYITRAELIQQKATGIVPEVDAETQRRFDRGHAFEATAREWAEEIIGEALYPTVLTATVDGLPLSASLDGQDLMGDVTWEHKTGSAALLASLDRNVIPDEHHPQLEQGLLLSGAYKCLFMASNGTRESMRFCWYESNQELRDKIIPTWKQFMADVAAYVPTAIEVKPTGKAPETLPALHIVLKGEVSASNLDEFKEVALAAIRSVNRDLQTDQDFADSAKARKWCEDIETKVEAAKQHALSQTATIDALFRALDEISDEAAKVRKELKKLEEARTVGINGEVVADGVKQFADHMRTLNASMPAPYMPNISSDFGGAIKGLRTVASKKNAVATELARVKIAADAMANRIHTNIAALRDAGIGMPPDLATLVIKAPDDFAAVIAQRKAAEQARLDAERERIRAEEAAKLQREAEAKAAAEKAEAERVEREAEAARKVREAAEEMARKSEQEEADRMERERQAAATPAPAPAVQTYDNGAPMYSTTTFKDNGQPIMLDKDGKRSVFCDIADDCGPTDDGARLTLTQLNAAIAPVSIDVAGLAALGFEPIVMGKSRLYRACDLPAICAAMARHLESVSESVAA